MGELTAILTMRGLRRVRIKRDFDDARLRRVRIKRDFAPRAPSARVRIKRDSVHVLKTAFCELNATRIKRDFAVLG